MAFLGRKYTKEELAAPQAQPKAATPPQGRTIEAKQGQNPICPHCGKNINERPEEVANPAIIQHYLDSLEEDNLTDWEKNFVASVSDQFDKKGSLSPKQTATLRKIYDEKGTA
jgi:hypothetical protein